VECVAHDDIEEQQRTLEALLDWSQAHRDWPADDVFGRVLRATFAQATKTFSAIARLTAEGYGEDAARLGRSLYESLIVAYWMAHAADPDWVVERMREHHEYGSLVWVETMERHPDWEQPEFEADRRARLEADRDRLNLLYGKFAEISWWAREVEQKDGKWKRAEPSRSLRSLIGELLEVPALEGRLWDVAEGKQRPTPFVQTLSDIPQRFNNQLIHHTPVGLAGYVDLVQDGVEFEDGPSESWVTQSQLFAYICYSLLVQLMIDR
jgi:hypothetical protein